MLNETDACETLMLVQLAKLCKRYYKYCYTDRGRTKVCPYGIYYFCNNGNIEVFDSVGTRLGVS